MAYVYIYIKQFFRTLCFFRLHIANMANYYKFRYGGLNTFVYKLIIFSDFSASFCSHYFLFIYIFFTRRLSTAYFAKNSRNIQVYFIFLFLSLFLITFIQLIMFKFQLCIFIEFFCYELLKVLIFCNI